MDAEAITLSPELRARGRKLYTARLRRPRGRGGRCEEGFDQTHRVLDPGREAEAALDARAQHAVGAEALDHCDKGQPEAALRAHDHRLGPKSELLKRPHFDQRASPSPSAAH